MITSLLWAMALAMPQGGPDLEAVTAAQARRIGMIARVAPAVCAVMPVHSPGGGSGVIVDPAGFVLTNFHVVQRRQERGKPGESTPPTPPTPPAVGPKPRFPDLPTDDDRDDPAWRTMKVGLPDGELYLADVLGIDPGSDLAMLLLRPHPQSKPYPYAALGDSDRLLAGQTVLAMGNPFLLAADFTPTVTWGIVSGTHRYQPGGGNRFLVYPDCIQVDAPVNPGNSGGPLFDELGQVVGINGRITVRERGRVNTGVGFAIASNQIRNFLADLLAGRHAEHGTLDLNAWYMTARDGQRRGVFVQSTLADSVAASLGVKLGDELLRFNGVQVRAANQLATLVGVLPAGSWVTLAFRPWDDRAERFAPEREIAFRLTRLDTGSSGSEDRLASVAHRQVARAAVLRAMRSGDAAPDGVTVTFRTAAGEATVLHRLGQRLRIDAGARALVRTATGAGFAREGATARDLTAEESALLERVSRCHPLLWLGRDRQALVDDSLLEGGSLVFGKPAYRFRQPGDGAREVWLFANGDAAGCAYRDPVAKAQVEWHFDAAGGRCWQIADGALLAAGLIEVSGPPAPELFERP